MNKDYYAVLIGFNKYMDQDSFPTLNYAKKDSKDLYDVLTHPEIGEFSKENVVLINDDHPYQTDRIEEILYKMVVKDRKPGDTVLVYYSGHGFIAGDRSRVYLATPEISLLNVMNNPKAGLGMFELYNDIFLQSNALNVIVMLDCCFSGSFNQPASVTKNEQIIPAHYDTSNFFLDDRLINQEGKVAFVSSSEKGYSRESHEFQNGIFTYFIVNGLKGSFNTSSSGEVALRTLADNVDNMMPSGQKPKFFGNPNRVVLTKPGLLSDDKNRLVSRVFAGLQPSSESVSRRELTCLENPIKKQYEYVSKLVECISTLDQDDRIPLATRILSAIRCSLDADFVLIRSVNSLKGEMTKAHSDFNAPGQQLDTYEENIVRFIYPLLNHKKDKLLPVRYGFYENIDSLTLSVV
jgi:Caspase domain